MKLKLLWNCSETALNHCKTEIDIKIMMIQ